MQLFLPKIIRLSSHKNGNSRNNRTNGLSLNHQLMRDQFQSQANQYAASFGGELVSK